MKRIFKKENKIQCRTKHFFNEKQGCYLLKKNHFLEYVNCEVSCLQVCDYANLQNTN